MQDNPYRLLAEKITAKTGGMTWMTGIVGSISPFTVEVRGYTVPSGLLLVNQQLVAPYHPEEKIKVGEKVALLSSSDGQSYLALCKVV